MPAANHGGKRPGSGRPKGSKSSTLERRELRAEAKKHGKWAVDFLARLMKNPRVPMSLRRECARDLLDRGYGKPSSAYEDADGQTIAPVGMVAFYAIEQAEAADPALQREPPLQLVHTPEEPDEEPEVEVEAEAEEPEVVEAEVIEVLEEDHPIPSPRAEPAPATDPYPPALASLWRSVS